MKSKSVAIKFQNLKKLNFKEDWVKLRASLFRYPRRKYLEQDKGGLTSTFGWFWLLLTKFNFLEGDWALGYASTQI